MRESERGEFDVPCSTVAGNADLLGPLDRVNGGEQRLPQRLPPAPGHLFPQ